MIDPGDLYYLWHQKRWFRKTEQGAKAVEWPVHPNTQADADREAERIAASLNAQPPKDGIG